MRRRESFHFLVSFSVKKCQRKVTLGAFLTSLLMAKEVSGQIVYLCKLPIRARNVLLNHASYKHPHENDGKAKHVRTIESFQNSLCVMKIITFFFLKIRHMVEHFKEA